jgi:hypothetical protein
VQISHVQSSLMLLRMKFTTALKRAKGTQTKYFTQHQLTHVLPGDAGFINPNCLLRASCKTLLLLCHRP